jgi:hypothetical protein
MTRFTHLYLKKCGIRGSNPGDDRNLYSIFSTYLVDDRNVDFEDQIQAKT